MQGTGRICDFFGIFFSNLILIVFLHPQIGRGVKPAIASEKFATGTLAQSVEQRTENPCVPGSIPGGTTNEK